MTWRISGRREPSFLLFSFAEELTESLAEAGDLSLLADLLLLAGVEGVRSAGDIQRHIGVGVAIVPLLGAIGGQRGADQKVGIAGEIAEQNLAVFRVNMGRMIASFVML